MEICKGIYDKSKIDWNDLLYSGNKLWKLLIPIILEQLLNSFMGMIDTMMVSNIDTGASMSAVSLVDSLNNLLIQLFSAMATGAAIVCSQYIGFNNCEKLKEISERKISPTWSDAYLQDSQDEMAFYTAIENAIKGRMRWKAIEKVDSDIEDMWKPKED